MKKRMCTQCQEEIPLDMGWIEDDSDVYHIGCYLLMLKLRMFWTIVNRKRLSTGTLEK